MGQRYSLEVTDRHVGLRDLFDVLMISLMGGAGFLVIGSTLSGVVHDEMSQFQCVIEQPKEQPDERE